MSVVVCKQHFLYENEFVQYLQNYKYYEIGQGYLRKFLQISTNTIKNV